MVWTETTRSRYERHFGRYASDLTDQEWALVAPILPPPKTIGRPRHTAMRGVMDAILYIASTGCAWRMLPNDFPPVSTVRYYFYRWRDDGIFEMASHFLVVMAREKLGRNPHPTASVVDSQTIKTTESGGISGYDAPFGECSIRLPGNGQADQRPQAPHHHRYPWFHGRTCGS